MQDYSKILIQRGLAPHAAPPAAAHQPVTAVSPVSHALAPCGSPHCADLVERVDQSAKQFSQPHARLFPLIGKKVWTTRGPGILLQVFATRCQVQPEGQQSTIYVSPVIDHLNPSFLNFNPKNK